MRQALVVLAVLMVSACGSAKPSVSPDELFMEYAQSTHVKNDLLATGATNGKDRLATLAAYYSGGELRGVLLFAYECGGNEKVPSWHEERCRGNDAVGRAAAGSTLFARSVIVKHGDGSLELVTLFVARSPGRSVLVDPAGRTYTDLENFRATNQLFSADDTLLTVRDIASAPGEGDLVTVTGRTSPTWYWWVLGGVLGVMIVLGTIAFVAGHRHQRRLTGQSTTD